MNLIEVEKVVSKIQTDLFKNSNSFSIGMMKSHFRGAGIQFKEHQLYNPGDDVRFIDWKLSARTNKTFIKTFEEERNVEVCAVIDFSPTLLYGYNNISKLQAALEIVCLLYLLAEKSHDYIKFIFLYDQVYELPSKRGREGITYLITLLKKLNLISDAGKLDLDYRPVSLIDEKIKMSLVQKFVAKRREMVFLSDFSTWLDKSKVSKISYLKNVHIFQLVSPLDEGKNFQFSQMGFNFLAKKRQFSFVSGKNKPDKDKPNKDKAGKAENAINQIFAGRKNPLRINQNYLEDFVKEML